jgi:hypothetical protein
MSDMTVAAEGTAANAELYALVAEFATVEGLMAAAEATRDAGYTKTDAYTPYPVEDLDEKLGMRPTRLGWVVLIMGTLGGLFGFWLQWFANSIYYPLNIGGKPLNSWPNFIVITFEFTVLAAAFTAGLFMLGRNGLPRPYHSIFNTPNFENVTRDTFFLSIEVRDEQFDLVETRAFLEGLSPTAVSEVER